MKNVIVLVGVYYLFIIQTHLFLQFFLAVLANFAQSRPMSEDGADLEIIPTGQGFYGNPLYRLANFYIQDNQPIEATHQTLKFVLVHQILLFRIYGFGSWGWGSEGFGYQEIEVKSPNIYGGFVRK